MTDHPTPDPFDDQLGARLHDAADQVDGPAVTRASVTAAIDRSRRRQARTRALLVGAAAAIAVIGGLAIVTQTGGDAPEQVLSGSPTTTVLEACDPSATDTAVGTGEVSSDDASDAEGADVADGADTVDGGVATTTTVLAGSEGEAPFDEWIDILRERGMVTLDQETAIAAGEQVFLTPEQSAVLQEHWDEEAADATTTGPAFAPGPAPTATTEPCTPAEATTTTT